MKKVISKSLVLACLAAKFFNFESANADFKGPQAQNMMQSNQNLTTVQKILNGSFHGKQVFLKGNKVQKFEEKYQLRGNWINGGFFVFNYKIFNFISGNQTMLEREPFRKLTKSNQLMAYKHHGFWQCMDTMRDKNILKKMWREKKHWYRASPTSCTII